MTFFSGHFIFETEYTKNCFPEFRSAKLGMLIIHECVLYTNNYGIIIIIIIIIIVVVVVANKDWLPNA